MADISNPAPVYYANQINALVTQFDMRIKFSQIEDVTDGKPSLRETVTVYLAPAQVRALRKMLNDKWEAYEKIWAARESTDGDT